MRLLAALRLSNEDSSVAQVLWFLLIGYSGDDEVQRELVNAKWAFI